jgi:IgGFc binding protein
MKTIPIRHKVASCASAHGSKARGRRDNWIFWGIWLVVCGASALWAPSAIGFDRLDSSWSLVVGGQTVRADDNGGALIPNITTPDQFGENGSGTAPDFVSDDFLRLTGQKTEGGQTRYVWSQPFQIRNRETYFISIADLTFSDTPLVKPEFIRVTAPKTLLNTVGETVQLATTAISPDITPDPADNPTEDVTPRAKFTVYRSSNPGVLTVSKDGLATARGNGHAIVTAVNSMVSGSLEIIVDNTVPTIVEGIVRKPDQTPVAGAIVTAQGLTGTTDAQGHFSIASVPCTGAAVIDITVNGPPIVTRTVTTVPGGISDAGIIILGTISNVGNEFIVLFERNYDATSVTQTLFATSSEAGFGTIDSPGLPNPISFQLHAGGVTGQVINSSLMITSNDTIENKGIRVAADKPFQLYGLSQKQFTTDAYTAIPVEALGTRYRVMSYPNLASAPSTESQFAIAATRDSTSVAITPTATGGARQAGVPYTITLNRLQSYQLQATTAGGDLTGTLIVSDKPLAVFSGHACADVPVNKASCDHMVEQIPSTDTWGSTFITVSLASRSGGDIIRILANTDNTSIQVRGGSTVDATLNAGETKEFVGLDINRITADKPVLVAQYSQGQSVDSVQSDPFMMLITPAIQFLNSYVFTTPVGTNITRHFVNIVAKTSDAQTGAVLLDGVAVPVSSFTAISGSDYSAARLPISAGDHRLFASQPMGIYVYGFGQADSYGYPGGLGLQRMGP